MAKKKSAKGETPKKEKAPAAAAAAKPEAQGPKPIIRAIRVSQDLLDAAKAYKKATGTNFYTLGFEALCRLPDYADSDSRLAGLPSFVGPNAHGYRSLVGIIRHYISAIIFLPAVEV